MDSKKGIKNKGCAVLTCMEAAQEMRTTTQTIRAWIMLGRIDPNGCFQVGKRGHWRIYRSALDKARNFARG